MKPESYDTMLRKVALTVIAVSVAPLILVSGLIFDEYRSMYSEKVYAHLAEVVDKHADNIDTFLTDKLQEVQYLNTAYTYDQLTDPDELAAILEGMQQQYGRILVDIGIVNDKGRQVSYAGPYDLLGADYSKASWYRKTSERQTGISDVFMGLRQTPHFIIAITNNLSDKPWTLRATIDFLAFSSMVENIRIGETGFAYILNNEGKLQTQRLGQVLPPIVPLESGGTRLPSPLGTVSIVETHAQDGKDYIIVTSPLKNGEWRLVYQQDASETFSDLIRSELYLVLISLIGSLAIVVTAVIIARKIVERFRAIDVESQIMNKQMVETGKLASIGELASGVAHEINNPVAIMIEEAGWIQDLLDDEESPLKSGAEIKRALEQIRTQGGRCKDITHKLLSFARVSDSEVTEVDLPPLIEEVVNLSMQQARYAQVNFNLDIEPNLPPLRASVTEMQQVLLNLVTNSIQAMSPEGGELSITCRRNAGGILLSVADTGPGIPAANLKRIFDPFFTTKPVGQGTGLGLSIVFGIIHQLDGEIDVESTVGKGTRFNIRLPAPAAPNNG